MRLPRWFLLSALVGAFGCSAEVPPPQPDTAMVAQCSAGADGPECPRNGQTGSLGRSNDFGIGTRYGMGIGCPAEVAELEPQADAGLGFSAQALIELVSGAHRESLQWLESSAGSTGAEAVIPSTSAELEVEIEVTGAPQLLSRNELEALVPLNAPPGAVPGAHCPTAIGLPVRVRMQSDDGTLDATVETTLESVYGDFARLAFVLPSNELPSAPAGKELAVELGITPLGLMGSLAWHSAQLDSDGASEPAGPPLAHFPAQRYCAPARRDGTRYNYTSQVHLERAQEFRGISLDDQLARLNRASPVSAHLAGSTVPRSLSLQFESADDHLCLELEPRGCTAELGWFQATLRQSTDDGEVDGELSLGVGVFADAAQPALSVHAYREAATLEDVPALVQGSGIHAALDYTGQHGAAVLFSALLEDEELQGSLTVIGRGPCLGLAGPADQCVQNTPLWMLDWGGPPYPYEESFCGAPRPARAGN